MGQDPTAIRCAEPPDLGEPRRNLRLGPRAGGTDSGALTLSPSAAATVPEAGPPYGGDMRAWGQGAFTAARLFSDVPV